MCKISHKLQVYGIYMDIIFAHYEKLIRFFEDLTAELNRPSLECLWQGGLVAYIFPISQHFLERVIQREGPFEHLKQILKLNIKTDLYYYKENITILCPKTLFIRMHHPQLQSILLISYH